MNYTMFKDLTFKEFTGWLNKQACTGEWRMSDFFACLDIYHTVNSVDVKKGFFYKKRRAKAQEAFWQQLIINARTPLITHFYSGVDVDPNHIYTDCSQGGI